MADALKVFKNQVAATKTASLSATTIDVIATTSTQQAVLKDMSFSISHSNPLYANVYKYPAKVKLNDFPLAVVASAAGLVLTGSQIVDSSSTLTIEIQPEVQKTYYGVFKAMLTYTGGVNFVYYDLALLGTSPAGAGPTILANAKKNAVTVISSTPTFRSGCTIMRNGVLNYCYTDGTTLKIITEAGVTVASYTWPGTTNAIVADDTYIYGKSASSDTILRRYNHQTLAAGTNLSLNTTVPGYGSSNKGFVDSYNGFMYIKINGSDGSIYKINLSSGAVTSVTTGLTDGEFLGGVVNVNLSGVPYIFSFGDTQYELLNLNTLGYTTYSSVFPTDPTTTSANNVISVANGVVLVSNGSYGTSAIIDFNNATPTMTLTTSTFAPASESYVFIGLQFQTAPVAVAREMVYNLLASGVESTN